MEPLEKAAILICALLAIAGGQFISHNIIGQLTIGDQFPMTEWTDGELGDDFVELHFRDVNKF
jgi:hypothetical protein